MITRGGRDGRITRARSEGERTAGTGIDGITTARGVEGDGLEAWCSTVEADRSGRVVREDGVIEGRGVDVGEGCVETR